MLSIAFDSDHSVSTTNIQLAQHFPYFKESSPFFHQKKITSTDSGLDGFKIILMVRPRYAPIRLPIPILVVVTTYRKAMRPTYWYVALKGALENPCNEN